MNDISVCYMYMYFFLIHSFNLSISQQRIMNEQ